MKRLEKSLEKPWRVNLNTFCIWNLPVISLNLTKRILYNEYSIGDAGFSQERPIPNKVYEHRFAELLTLYRKAIDAEMQQLAQALRDRQIIPINKKKS